IQRSLRIVMRYRFRSGRWRARGHLALSPSPSGGRSSPGEQARVAAGGGGVDRGHALGGEADDIVRAARLGAGSRKALAAERLAADDRADLVAVDVEIADASAAFDKAAG